MKNELTFETMDWELEAARVKAAFGLAEECWFMLVDPSSKARKLIQRNQSYGRGVVLDEEKQLLFYCNFTKEWGRGFAICSEVCTEDNLATELEIRWDGSIERGLDYNGYSDQLIKALFFLDLLTPEIEASLGGSISAHQKLEWAIEKPVRMRIAESELATYSEMDWKLEAQRLKDAFDFVGDCEMIEEEPNTFVIGGFIAGSRSISIDVIYRNHFQIFVVDGWEPEHSAWFTFLPDGKVRYATSTGYNSGAILAEGLYHLGLLSDDVVAHLGGVFSTLEKQKWQQEYDARTKAN